MVTAASPWARRTAWGTVWSMAGLVGGRSLGLLSTLVLVRLLTPEDFGLVAFGLAFLVYLETLGDLGAGSALIYGTGHRQDTAQATFLVSVVTGGTWFVLCFLAAPAVASFFQRPDGAPFLRALSVALLIKGLGTTHDALCSRELGFKARMLPELGLAGAKALVAIPLAAMGAGAWSLVTGQLVGVTSWTVLMWRVVPWRPRLRLSRAADLQPVLRFGSRIVGVNVVAAVVHHVDLVVVGRMLGASALGLYHVAGKITESLIQLPVWAVSRVMFPALSRMRDTGRLAPGYLAGVRYLSLATLPAAVTLTLLSDLIVQVLLGPEWSGAATALRGLAVATCLRSLGTGAGDALKAAGAPGTLAALGLARGIVLLPALIAAGRVGLGSVAWTLAAVSLPFALLNTLMACRRIGIGLRPVGRALAPGAGSALPMAAAILAGRALLGPFGASVVLPLAALLGVIVYGLALIGLFPEVIRQAREGLVRQLPPPPTARRLEAGKSC